MWVVLTASTTGWVTESLPLKSANPVATQFKAWVCGRSLAGITGSNVARGMDVWLLWVLLGRRFCVRLTTRPEESYRISCVWLWSWRLDNQEALANEGLLRHGEKNSTSIIHHILLQHLWINRVKGRHFTVTYLIDELVSFASKNANISQSFIVTLLR